MIMKEILTTLNEFRKKEPKELFWGLVFMVSIMLLTYMGLFIISIMEGNL